MKFSVIVASYKQQHYIFDALQSIFDQEAPFPFEVIVVDSGCDGTAELVKERFQQAVVIALSERAYPGAARNHGIRAARGEILAFTDSDCVVDRHWLRELCQAHEKGYPVVGGLVKNGTPFSVNGTLDYLIECTELMTPWATTGKDHFGTGNVSFLRSVVDRYGMFADQVKGSDNMYFRRIHAEGQVLYWEPRAKVWHRNRTSLKKVLKNQYELGIGAAINRKKHAVRGKIFINHPVLIPLIPLVRIFTIGGRILRYSFFNFLKFILLLPLVILALICYTAGFYRGVKS